MGLRQQERNPRTYTTRAQWTYGVLMALFPAVPLPYGRRVERAFVECDSGVATQAVLYKNIISNTHVLDFSIDGTMDQGDECQPIYLFPGDVLIVVWPTAAPGSTATCTITYVPVG